MRGDFPGSLVVNSFTAGSSESTTLRKLRSHMPRSRDRKRKKKKSVKRNIWVPSEKDDGTCRANIWENSIPSNISS